MFWLCNIQIVSKFQFVKADLSQFRSDLLIFTLINKKKTLKLPVSKNVNFRKKTPANDENQIKYAKQTLKTNRLRIVTVSLIFSMRLVDTAPTDTANTQCAERQLH